LVEAMITIAILAILVVMAAPAIGDWLLNAQIRTASESLLDGLQKTRNEAVRRNAPVEFVLDAGTTSGWTIQLANVVPVEVIERREPSEGSSQAAVSRVPGEATIITFDGMGRRLGPVGSIKNFDGSDMVVRMCVDLPSTVLDPSKTRNLQIDISRSGQVRMCDPAVYDPDDSRYCEGYPDTGCTGLPGGGP
jgi:type IV fimbrial biogenesis protein FimT